MKPLDVMKQRIQETRNKKTRAEMQIEQNKKQIDSLYAEVSELAGKPVSTTEDVQKIRDEQLGLTNQTMRKMAKELDEIGVLTESDKELLRSEDYL